LEIGLLGLTVNNHQKREIPKSARARCVLLYLYSRGMGYRNTAS